jgi:hypothetical protein
VPISLAAMATRRQELRPLDYVFLGFFAIHIPVIVSSPRTWLGTSLEDCIDNDC